MTALHEITGDMKGLQLLVDSGDMTIDKISDTLEMVQRSFEDKAKNLMFVHDNVKADVVAIEAEIKRLTARKKIMTNSQESMKEYLRSNMEASGISKIECPLFTITLKKGRDIVSIVEESNIPSDYMNIKTSITPMKKEILADLKKGISIDGAVISKSKTSLLIK